MSEETLALIRKYNNNIEMSGLGVIAFGIWEVLKFFINIVAGTDDINDYYMLVDDVPTPVVKVLVVIFLMCFYGGILFLHVYRGFSAIRFARARSNKKTFLIWLCLLAIYSICSLAVYIGTGNIREWDDGDVITIFVELSFMNIIFDIIYSFYRIKKIQKKEGLDS